MGNYLLMVKRRQISRKILSIFLLIFLLTPSFLSPTVAAFSFFGFGSDEEVSVHTPKDLPKISIEKWVAVLVEDSLYQPLDIKAKIDRYATDAAMSIGGRAIIIPVPKTASPKDIYAGLSELYFMGPNGDGKSQLEGIVLIGDVPIPIVEKNGRYWPTIFPYIDFEGPAYYWDDNLNRFRFDSTANIKADIWHGVIRSLQDTESEKRREISDFLDKNHDVHTGKITFSDKALYVNTETQNNIPETLVDRYNHWITYLEEVVYKRYTKVLLKKIEEDLNKNNSAYVEHEIPNSVMNELITTLSDQLKINQIEAKKLVDTIEDRVPDIKTSDITKVLANDFERVNEAWNKVILDQVESTGGWTKDELDTTVEMLTTKDKLSALRMKMVNDNLEKIITKLLESYNIPEHISVTSEVKLIPPKEVDEPNPETIKKPLYWNGVKREEMNASSCTLYRGTPPTEETPFAQQVIANRTLDVDTIHSCAFAEASKVKKEADKYAGCCIDNLYRKGKETLKFCDTGSLWKPSVTGSDWIHQGARKPVYSISGTRLESGPSGALGCEPILAKDNEDPDIAYRFNSLTLHVEPTLETRRQQLKTGTARALPVDDPRGFSFYDHGRDFQRINFINVFGFRKKIKSEEDLKMKLLSALRAEISHINMITRQGNEVSDNRYERDKEAIWPTKVYELPKDLKFKMEGSCQYIKKFAQADPFTRQITWFETCDYASSSTTPPKEVKDPIHIENKVIRYYEVGKLIPINTAERILKQIDIKKLYEAITWVDKELKDKSQWVLSKMLSDPETGRDFFMDPTINGYELVHLATGTTEGDRLMVDFLPQKQDIDEDFIKAKARNIGVVPAIDAYKPKLLKKSVENLIKEGGTLITKDQIPRILNQVNLKGNQLSVSPSNIVTSKSGNLPIPITFSLKNKKGQIQKDDYEHEVTMKFSSSDVAKFFEVKPDQKVVLNGGVATFYLKPKAKHQKVGARFKLWGELVADNTKIVSKSVPVTVSRYYARLTTADKEMVVNDQEGTMLTMKIQDEKGKLTHFLDGKNIDFTTTSGSFAGGVNTAQVDNGMAKIRFFPGTKAGTIIISAHHKDGLIPSASVELIVRSGEADRLEFETDNYFFIRGADFHPVLVSLRDRFGNKVTTQNHELTWQIEGAKVENRAEIDIDPRRNGIQEWVTKPVSELKIKPTAKTIDLTITSSLLGEDKAITKHFVVADQPQFSITGNKDFLIAGNGESMKSFIYPQTASETPIKNKITVKTLVTPANFLHLPETITVKNGRALFEIAPGTKSGIYKVSFLSDGFKTKTIEVEVRPNKAQRIRLSTDKILWDKDAKEILLDMVLVDAFGNKVERNLKASLRTTEGTKDLIKIDTEDVTLTQGQRQVKIHPRGKSGEVHLLAEAEDVFGSTLSLRLADLLTLDEVRHQFTPKSKLMLLTGTPAANLLKNENVATTLLFAGKTEAVGALSVPYESVNRGYGSLGEDGMFSGEIRPIFVSDTLRPKIILRNSTEHLSELTLIYKTDLDIYFRGTNQTKGIVITKNKKVKAIDAKLKLKARTLWWEDEPLLSFTKKGGVKILSPNIELKTKGHNFKVWKIERNGRVIADFEYKQDSVLQLGTVFEEGEFEGVTLESLSAHIAFTPILTGNSTNGARGFEVIDTVKKATDHEVLGRPEVSVEETEQAADEVWTGDWNPAALFAAGNTIGASVTLGSSDAFLLLGDPTLTKTPKDESKSDIGTPIWEANSPIEDFFLTDINGDGYMDLLARTETVLTGLYNSGRRNEFVSVGPLMQLDSGIKSLATLSHKKGGSTEGNPSSLVQINTKGDFVFHKNEDGKFSTAVIPFAQKFETIKSANLNGDPYEDLVALDRNQKLWKIIQSKDGFDDPIFLADLTPRFDTIRETTTSTDIKYLKQIRVKHEALDRFIPLPSANIKTDFQLKTDTGKAPIGTTVKGLMKLQSAKTLENVILIMPGYKHLSFKPETLRCLDCSEGLSTKVNSISGDIYFYIPEILADTPMTLYWEMKVDSLEKTKFFVGDFEGGKDGFDDIIVPWDQEGTITILKFLSSENNTLSVSHWLSLLLSLKNKIDHFFVRTALALENISVEEGSEELEVLPDTIITEEDLQQRVYRNDYFEKDESLKPKEEIPIDICDTVKPSKTIGGIAPGLDFVYDSEKSPYAKPLTLQGGQPQTQILTTQWTSHGPAPALNKIGVVGIDPPVTAGNGIFPSSTRVYTIPTTMGKTVSAVCKGFYSLHMKVGLWLPNCYVLSIPRKTEAYKTCKKQKTDLAKVVTESKVFITGKKQNVVLLDNQATKKPGTVILEPKNKHNYKALAVDRFSQWMSDQFRYFSQNYTEILPDVTLVEADDRVEKSTSIKVITKDTNQVSDVIQQLNETLPVTINTKKVTIAVPKVPAGSVLTEDEQSNLDSYNELKSLVFEKEKENMKTVAEALAVSKELTQYKLAINEKNKKVIEAYKQTADILQQLLEVIRLGTADVTTEFTKKYKTNAVDRGTGQPWLYELLAGKVDPSVLTFETYPDIEIDTSDALPGGIIVNLIDIELQDVEVEPKSIKPYHADIYPKPDMVVTLPSFPEIPPPPEIPIELFEAVMKRMEVPRSFMGLFGQMRLGIAPVPEWWLKPYVEQLTNQRKLYPYDRKQEAKKDINRGNGTDKTRQEDLPNLLEVEYRTPLQQLKAQALAFKTKNKEQEAFRLAVLELKDLSRNQKFENQVSFKLENPTLMAKELDIKRKVRNLMAMAKKPIKDFVIAYNQQRRLSSFLTANNTPKLKKVTILDIKKSSKKNEVKQFMSTSNDSENGLYQQDPTTGILTKILYQNLEPNTKVKLFDIDNDGDDEIFYTNGNRLYVKGLKPLTRVNNDNRVESMDLVYWTYDKFRSHQGVARNIKPTATGISFEPINPNIGYYEWFLSDRPDSVFEMTKRPEKRLSERWERHGFIRQILLENYRINKVPALVTRVEGKPKIKTIKSHKLPKYDHDDCSNREIKKPLFDTRSVLTAKEDETKLEIRVPARQFKPSEYQAITLNRGESTSIDYGEVCVFDGSLEVIKMSDEPTTFVPKIGTSILTTMETEMTPNSFLQLQFGDGSRVDIYAQDHYMMHFFDPSDNPIGYGGLGSHVESLYGFLMGLERGERTVVHRKLLHPPTP